MSDPVLGAARAAALRAVVIGASAGGVEALLAIARCLPADLAMPVLIVLHLPPDRPSGIAALLAPRCALPVDEAVDKAPILPGRVLVAPPDYHLLVEPAGSGWAAALSADEPVRWSRPAIDPLFESAAFAFGSQLLAIVLTGASDDGAEGLRVVRRHGGLGWVQDPATAVAATMPSAALELAGADAVLTLEQICQQLAALPHA